MYEEMASWGPLLKEGVMSWKEYESKLDARFEAQPGDALLMRLEWCASRHKDALVILLGLLDRRDLDLEALGRWVFRKMEEVYRRDDCCIDDFDRLIRAVWAYLPDGIRNEDVIFRICYTDEILAYSGEAEARDVYEAAFRRYHLDAPPFVRPEVCMAVREEPVRRGLLYRLLFRRKVK